MIKIWEKITQPIWDEAMQTGTSIGFLAGLQAAINYMDELIAMGDLSEEQVMLLEACIEDMQNYGDD